MLISNRSLPRGLIAFPDISRDTLGCPPRPVARNQVNVQIRNGVKVKTWPLQHGKQGAAIALGLGFASEKIWKPSLELEAANSAARFDPDEVAQIRWRENLT